MSVIITEAVDPAVSLKSPQLKGPHSLPRLAQIAGLQGRFSCLPCQWGAEAGLGDDGLGYGRLGNDSLRYG